MSEIARDEADQSKHARAIEIARRSFQKYGETYKALAGGLKGEIGNQTDRKF
jgi:hypothetical protein